MDKQKEIIKGLIDFRGCVNKEVPINTMLLFGSYAKGKSHKWSDVDLVVVSQRFIGIKSYKRARRLYDYWNLDYPVDFLCYTPAEFNKLKKQITIVREAVMHGIEIK